jgi:hypothetical protein
MRVANVRRALRMLPLAAALGGCSGGPAAYGITGPGTSPAAVVSPGGTPGCVGPSPYADNGAISSGAGPALANAQTDPCAAPGTEGGGARFFDYN